MRIFISAGSFAAAIALDLGSSISLKIMIQIAMRMHWRINAEMALLAKVYFVTPQN